MPYIPKAVPRLVFVDRRRGGRVSASASARAGLRSSGARNAGATDLPSAKTGPLSAADGCDVAAAGATGPRTKDLPFGIRDEEVHVQGGAGRVPQLGAGSAARERPGDPGDAAS